MVITCIIKIQEAEEYQVLGQPELCIARPCHEQKYYEIE